MAKNAHESLSRRERQIMNVIYSTGSAGVQDVMEKLPDPPSYSAVRAMLRVLEDKGHLRHYQEGQRYVYVPTVPREKARESAMRQIVGTFFDGSAEQAVAALLDMSGSNFSSEELERLAAMIAKAREEGR